MVGLDHSELMALHQEYEWVLTEELPRAYSQLTHVLEECVQLFPISDGDGSTVTKSEKFIMSAAPHTTLDHVKAVVTISGDSIMQADINVRLGVSDGKRSGVASGGSGSGSSGSGTSSALQRTSVTPDAPWRLQQIQDACNYLKQALVLLQNNDLPKTGEGSVSQLSRVCQAVQQSRQCLLVPRRRTIEELLASPNMKALSPPLVPDTALSFYIQVNKLLHPGDSASTYT
ncbi:protein rogdi [Hyalella azteca]|uniref:Protein rogdi n=1 Tax=Hyalella azteca TaxID=294128 RepID=A0A8B7N3D1_HYAAZ|nr:protein rogdi [Hyalella azteca]